VAGRDGQKVHPREPLGGPENRLKNIPNQSVNTGSTQDHFSRGLHQSDFSKDDGEKIWKIYFEEVRGKSR
jgi:hypothetical protein